VGWSWIIRTSALRDPRLCADLPTHTCGVHVTAVAATSARTGPQVSIEPNVVVGADCTIGERVMLGPNCVIGGDVPIATADRGIVSGMTHISRSIMKPGVYSGSVLHSAMLTRKRNALRFAQVDRLVKRIARLEKARR